ncbi:T3SS effector HopA1 family protein [Spirosoma pollinicola]|uniref:Uncharacterized protein n=1 Tax=Spirosoma pollinicola TaxID=2057025 RepID=A0A2K8Z8C2_9BACT|nr:T3SS effector HopA1 family protein [Spirosoma pollinicola]AUD06123.1 hypothetical protein CWM47_32330 [Spirosoma pollinicola]
MTNDKIICELLKHVRYYNGILQVLTASGSWVALADWSTQGARFSTYRLNSINYTEQINQLSRYFYCNFYVNGRFVINQAPKPTLLSNLSLTDSKLSNRPKVNNEAILQAQLDDGTVIIEQDTTRFTTKAGDYVYIAGSKPEMVKIFNGLPNPQIDILVRTKECAGGEEFKDTFYWSYSVQPGYDSENQHIRFYIHPYPDQAPAVTHTLITYLDSYKIPFRVKYFNPVLETNRCDRIVLYVPQRQFVIASWVIIHTYTIHKGHLQDHLPLFVKRLLPGIGFAEDPFSAFSDESFGESRCTWIADAVVQWVSSLPTGSSAQPPPKKLINDILKNQKINNLETMFLNPGSFYPYDFELFQSNVSIILKHKKVSFWLQGAIDIANFLCREAVWIKYDQCTYRCTWIGAGPDDDEVPIYKPLEKDWERGILGPVLFLYILMKYIDDPLYNYIIEHTDVPNLKDVLSKAEPSIRPDLLRVYDYQKNFSFLFIFYKVKIFFANCILTKDKEFCQDKLLTEGGVTADSRTKGPDYKIYCCLLSILVENAQKPHWRPKEFYQKLKEIHIKSREFLTNEWGWGDFFPGMNGLTLVGFSYLLAYDPLLPPIPTGNLSKECK